ncbi:MAG: cysteine--tRNA ligase [Streptosporangiales bacterium]|nr:cysteine--tRNA ligase [Streptosporangiales bacterium]
MYVCGITPYDVTHLGHAATFVWTDAAARVLRHIGAEVQLTRNVTDVDDVLLEAARRAGSPYDRFAAVQQFRFDQDMAALGVRRPTHEPRAHSYIIHVVALGAALLVAGRAYLRDGSVYFRGADVHRRVGLDRDAALRLAEEYGGRVDDPAKEDPLDVAVWQASGPDEPSWPSPWGPGRPGWHAECTAMALSTYGPALDLHAGGADLRFPHHAYEAAQAEAVTGVRPFARAWMHVGTVRVGGEKMAKSAGNLVLVSDLLTKHPAAAVRLLVLDRAWAEPWGYEPAELAAAEQRLEELYSVAGRAESSGAVERAVVAALLEDLDVPRALRIALDEGGGAARTLIEILGLR